MDKNTSEEKKICEEKDKKALEGESCLFTF
jgi:hypothetical protein